MTNTHSDKNNGNTSNSINLKNYFNINQFRNDTWHCLKASCNQLMIDAKAVSDRESKIEIENALSLLTVMEHYWVYPGTKTIDYLSEMYKRKEFRSLLTAVSDIVRSLVSEAYRERTTLTVFEKRGGKSTAKTLRPDQHYFEVLFVDDISVSEETRLKHKLTECRKSRDHFVYDTVLVRTLQDAVVALLFNHNIQSCVIRYGCPFRSRSKLDAIRPFIVNYLSPIPDNNDEEEIGPFLGRIIKSIRPEIDLFYVTDTGIGKLTTDVYRDFQRVFFRQDDLQELHLSVLKGIQQRFEAPFFSALVKYSQQPTGVFHAMPLSRGNSILNSHWIQDMGHFYGRNIFLAETSATTGGLDSLLQPTGPLKKAQSLAARAFGALHTFFVTNGTSTSNKIVLQALLRPGDIVLIDRDCHKSNHYGQVLSGAYTIYLDAYPLEQYSMYGAVSLREIKQVLLDLRRGGRLDQVKMLLLTNCTFDGIVYDVQRLMEEVLAIKPNMIFLWDEAWFGFAYFSPVYRQRTAMHCAEVLSKRFKTKAYQNKYKKFISEFEKLDQDDDDTWLLTRLLPDPNKAKIRVYANQSTHKKLSSLRQGAMIHVHDEEFNRKVEDTFHEAYMTHTSTSPNYQILASLDVARRQVEFEGYEFVEKAIEMAMTLRAKINDHPVLKRFFEVLTTKDLIPREYRPSGQEHYYDSESGWYPMENSWKSDEFVLDPTHITLDIGRTGVDGDTFKNQYLMDQFGIQVNKTTRNTVLFMTNIGTTRSAVAYLISVLLKTCHQLEDIGRAFSPAERAQRDLCIESLTNNLPPLPDFSYFHPAFRPYTQTPEGDIRSAYFLAYDDENCEFLQLDGDIQKSVDSDRDVVSASFVIPYPPGFPILVPGQVINKAILDFMLALDVKEIHGYRPGFGLRVFTEEAITRYLKDKGGPVAVEHLISSNGHERQSLNVGKKDTNHKAKMRRQGASVLTAVNQESKA